MRISLELDPYKAASEAEPPQEHGTTDSMGMDTPSGWVEVNVEERLADFACDYNYDF